MSDFFVDVMLHKKEYRQKPTKYQTAKEINYQIMNCHTRISIPKLAEEVAKGKTFCPAYFNGKLDLNKFGQPRKTIMNWTSQQIICLDFDNTRDKKKHITMTIEQAINEFSDSAAFIYKSFNHSEDHPKFRVVFVLDEKIENYDFFTAIMDGILERYPDADQQCKDGSRLFYGGTEMIELNFKNKLTWNVKDLEGEISIEIKAKNEGKGGFCVPVRSKVIKYSSNRDKKTPLQSQKANDIKKITIIESNQKLIQTMDIEMLQRIINPKKKSFYTYEEVYDYLKRQDLGLFLGLYGSSFRCIFHDDHDSSANIYINEATGHYMYKCFSDNCKFKHGTIMKCVERILGCNKVEGLRFLRKVYMVEYHETSWQKEQREILDENIRYIRSRDFQAEYPVQYKLIRPYLDDLHTFLVLAKDNLPPEHYSEEQKMPIFYATLNQFADLRGYKDHRRLTDRLALFAYLCYVYKLSEEQTPEKILKQARREVAKKKGDRPVMNITSFFSIPSYSENVLSAAEDYAEKYYKNHLTMSNWGWEMLYRTFGKDEADRVYPQLSKKRISEISHEHLSRIERILFQLIDEKGYAVEDDVVAKVDFEFGGAGYKKKQLKVCIGEIINKYELNRMRLNKKLKEKYGYKGNGYPYVILKVK